jgi:hypothetical protein
MATEIMNIQAQGKIFLQLKIMYDKLYAGFLALPSKEEELRTQIQSTCQKIQKILSNPTKSETNRELNLIIRNSKALIQNLTGMNLTIPTKTEEIQKPSVSKNGPVKVVKKDFLRNLPTT